MLRRMKAPSRPRSDFALLGVPKGAGEQAVRRAFLNAVKAHRPDQGGDPDQYREVIAAYRRLRGAPPQHELDVHLDLRVGAELARSGGPKMVTLPTGRTLRVTVPAGVKSGRTLRLQRQGLNAPGRWGDVYLHVVVAEGVRMVPEMMPNDHRPNASALLRRFAASWAA